MSLRDLAAKVGLAAPVESDPSQDGDGQETPVVAPQRRGPSSRQSATSAPAAPVRPPRPTAPRAPTITEVDPGLEEMKKSILDQLGDDAHAYGVFSTARRTLRKAMPGAPEDQYLKGALVTAKDTDGISPTEIVQDLVLLPMALDRVRDDFAQQAAGYRDEKITQPQAALEGKKRQLEDLEAQVTQLKGDLQTEEEAIAGEEEKLRRQQSTFESAMTAVRGDFTRDMTMIQKAHPETASANKAATAAAEGGQSS